MKNNIKNILLISWSGVIAWFLNYIYHPIMLQYLTIEEFWIFWSLVWIFNLLGIITTGIILYLNKEVSQNIKDINRVKSIYLKYLKKLGLWSIILYLMFILSSSIISNFLHINDKNIINLIWISIIGFFLWSVIHSVLRGLKKFDFLGIYSVLFPLIKLIIGIFLMALGLKLYGAIFGFIFGLFITVLIGLYYFHKLFKKIPKHTNANIIVPNIKEKRKEILNFFIMSSLFWILMNIDIILIKNIFDERTAGIYAWVAILWKFLIFLLLSIETVYYWQIMEYTHKKVPFHLIKNPLILIIITSISAIIINYFIWWFILKILKDELANYTYIYILSLIYYWLLALISFYTKILVWWGKYYINYIMWLLTLALIILIYTFWKSSLENFIYSFIIIWTIGSIIISVIFFREYRKIK